MITGIRSYTKSSYNYNRENDTSKIKPNSFASTNKMFQVAGVSVASILLYKAGKGLYSFFKRPLDKVITKPNIVQDSMQLVQDKLKPLFDNMRKNEIFNPEKIDKEMKTLAIKAEEKKFYKTKDGFNGRVICYTLNDGSEYLLEAREAKHKPIVRFFKNTVDGERQYNRYKRFYINNQGYFKQKSYMNSDTHLKSDNSALDWIAATPNTPQKRTIFKNIFKECNVPTFKNIKALEKEISVSEIFKTRPDIWIQGDKPNVSRIDALMTHYAGGKKNIIELPYISNSDGIKGRKIRYKIPNEGVFVLKAYQAEPGKYKCSLSKIVDKNGTKFPANKRPYLSPNGAFRCYNYRLDACVYEPDKWFNTSH